VNFAMRGTKQLQYNFVTLFHGGSPQHEKLGEGDGGDVEGEDAER
jgi:hypothetical protein